MNQHLLEISLISSVFILTLFGIRALRKSPLSGTQKAEKAITGLLGAYFAMAGSVKFFDPFTTMYTTQIALAELPFPSLTRWSGQMVEIGAGLMLLWLMVKGKSLASGLSDRLFYLGNFLIFSAMIVALYVHWHPNVPATVLPLQSKAPIMTLIVMLVVGINVALRRLNPQA
ncbi:hypothetical protein [Ferrimonas marina]|uniref:DoxX-like family protein n=1 Tax=Ferrimonas marina TaxID=299255 RepID=A0A1M5MPX2_9GAMM|nr:hypothetical protein [Ferrimonas marina]SHG79348.1 hypothetical protein SAMN02745129_0730 [Ferrimonas marina]